jgi:non-canonical purine NTP pyrophosphatase (RdgB/HAM1 family)
MLYFITGNKNKFSEVKAILSEVEQLDIDLPEIQDMDAQAIIRAKLQEAFNHAQGEFIVEDTSLYLDAMNGLPGPLIKWFLKAIGIEGLAGLAEKLGNKKAIAKTIIGYAKNRDEIQFFEGTVHGTIVMPQGETGFGWDPIFLPDGHEKTFAEMSREEKNELSMRRMAVNKLKKYLYSRLIHH